MRVAMANSAGMGGWTGRIRLALGVLTAAAGFFAVTTLSGVRTTVPAVGTVDGWLIDCFGLAAGGLCLLRAVLVRRERVAWAVLGIGLALYGAGTVYFYAVVTHQVPQPYPSPADAGWLAFYPAAYVCIVLLLRSRLTIFHSSIWLDGLVGGLGVAALSGVLTGPLLHGTGTVSTAALVNLAYPVGDMLLLVLVVSALGMLGMLGGLLWWLLGLAVGGFAVADTLFLLQVARGPFVPGSARDVLWCVALLLPAYAAWLPWRLARPDPDRRALRVGGWAVMVIPTLFTGTSLALLGLQSVLHVPAAAVVLATATVVTALVRGGLTFIEVEHLAEIRVQARTDDLTGLANRRGLIERVAHAESGNEGFAVLILDLDRFKEINDSLGHQVGDDLLRAVSGRIGGQLRSDTMLARLGGDEFAVFLAGCDAEQATAVATRIAASVAAPFEIGGMSVHVGVSIGIAVYPDHADSGSETLRCADLAMYAAKAGRSSIAHYQPPVDQRHWVRRDAVHALGDAIRGNQLVMHFQPKLDLRTGTVDSVEALVRWQHPTRGLLYPDEFISVVEQSGLIRPLTIEVLRLSLRQCRAWWDTGMQIDMAVNLSASNLLDTQLPDQVAALLAEAGLPATALLLEITETTLMLDHIRSTEVLGALRKLGVRISVDDYGTGYSSLAYLREFPVDELKLGRSFVVHLGADQVTAAIVESTINLAHALGMRIVAEGVETEAALRQLISYGCDLAQGYLITAARPGEAMTGWLVRHRAAADPLAAATSPPAGQSRP
jgi:diguanylate cyclase